MGISFGDLPEHLRKAGIKDTERRTEEKK